MMNIPNALLSARTLNFGHTTAHRRVTDSNETIRECKAMIIILLLLSRAGCDWVQISQNHYRKEPIHKVVNFEHTTKPYRIYRNNSETEEQWHRGAVDKVSNVASIRRVQYPSVKTNSLKTRHEDHRFNFHNEHNIETTEAEYDFITIKPNIEKFHTYYDEDDDVVENQSRVTVIRTSTANIGHEKHPNSKPNKKFQTAVTSIDRRKHNGEIQNEDVNDILNTNRRNLMQISKPSIEKLNLNEHNKFYTLERPNLHRVSLKDELNSSAPKEFDNRYSNYSITKGPNISKIKLFQREDNDKVKENDYNPHNSRSHPLQEYFESRNKNPTGHIDNNKNAGKLNEPHPKIPIQSTNNRMELTPSIDYKETKPNAEDSGLKDMNTTKVNPKKGMWKLVKVVADTIYKNTHRSFKSKITYLEGLKATILTSIEDQIDSAWPDDASGAPARHRRAAHPRGHVEFPSSESTLMTISFLTFAVFLIKLVLQVIHTYKNKTMMLTPTIVSAVGRAAAAFRTTS